jgi:hypothetical protein
VTARGDTAEYDRLPEPVRMQYTFEEWMWLSDAEKANLVSRETSFEDGGA